MDSEQVTDSAISACDDVSTSTTTTVVTTDEEMQHITTIITSKMPADETSESTDASISSIDSSTASVVSTSSTKHARDSSWLELEVCREFVRGDCSRTAEDCRYAHPTGSVIVKDGKVTCCFDYLKDRCTREHCKYLHPSNIIKDRLVMAGKQYGQAMAVSSKPMLVSPLSPTLQPLPVSGTYSLSLPYVTTSTSTVGHMAHPDTPTFTFPPSPNFPYMSSQVEVCREFEEALCSHGETCYYAHPEPYVRRNNNNTVSVCWNFMKGFCRHQQCWFYHPPPHIMTAMSLLAGGSLVPQPFLDPMLIPSFTSKPSYSAQVGLGGPIPYFTYDIPPMMNHYSPSSVPITTIPVPISPPMGSHVSTLPQAIVN